MHAAWPARVAIVNRMTCNLGSLFGKGNRKSEMTVIRHSLQGREAIQRRFFPRALVVRQSARPTRRRARKNFRRAREKSARN